MAKSIIQKRTSAECRECFLCREEAERNGYYGELRHTGLHKHHFVFGRWGAFREKAEHYGLWGYVCNERHHEYGPDAPHNNAEVRRYLSQVAQRAFEAKYSHELWMKEFGVNYVAEEEPEEVEEVSAECSDGGVPEGFCFIPNLAAGLEPAIW